MEKWEYKIITQDLKGWAVKKIDPKTEQDLNELGDKGWELVSFTPLAGRTSNAWGASTGAFVSVFKRKRS